jgi:hypothetical protein
LVYWENATVIPTMVSKRLEAIVLGCGFSAIFATQFGYSKALGHLEKAL